MGDKILIFGSGDFARLARIYLEEDGGHEVVAFAADADFVKEDSFEGLPLMAIDEAKAKFPPGAVKMFVAVGASKVNAVRARIYEGLKAEGYEFASYVYSGVRLWSSNKIGENTFIFEDNTVQPNVAIGDDVIVWSGNHLGHDCTVGDHVFITSHVCIAGHARIGDYCFLGINANIRDGIAVGDKTVVGAGATIMADAEGGGVYIAQATERHRLPSHKLRGL